MSDTPNTPNKIEVFRVEHAGQGICKVMGSTICPLYRVAAHLAGEAGEVEHCEFPCHEEGFKAIMATAVGTPLGEAVRKQMLYAFPSLNAFRNWFPSLAGRKAMALAGAKGWVYEVPALVAKGPYQCVFDLRTAVRVREFDLTEPGPGLEPSA